MENCSVNLLGCGAILLEVIKASEYLLKEYNISSNVWSVTSFTELKREANSVERYNRLNPSENPRLSYVQECLPSKDLPVIAATDYVRAYSDQIRSEIKGDFVSLGTDGFGRSDTRLELRKFYEVDCDSIVIAALGSLARIGKISVDVVEDAIKKFDIEPNSTDPFTI